MNNSLEKYVNALTEAEMLQIIEGHENLKKDCCIGDEPIRLLAMDFLKLSGIPKHNIVMWMDLLAGECHRHFSALYRSQM